LWLAEEVRDHLSGWAIHEVDFFLVNLVFFDEEISYVAPKFATSQPLPANPSIMTPLFSSRWRPYENLESTITLSTLGSKPAFDAVHESNEASEQRKLIPIPRHLCRLLLRLVLVRLVLLHPGILLGV
jgi:hypothetical protein